MRLKRLLVIFLVVFLSSCATFKPLPTRKYLINGVFNANFEGKEFDGFFSLNKGNLRLDIINSLGFSIAGVYVENGNVFVKDYQSGKTYTNIKVEGMNINQYKEKLVYLAENFSDMCRNRTKGIIVLRCKKVKGLILPIDFILVANRSRLKIDLKNVKVFLK